MSMTEVVEESLKADPRFRHLTVMRGHNFDECMFFLENEFYESKLD